MSFDVRVSKAVGEKRLDVTIQSEDRLVAVIGPSGIGKTTLLNCVAGLVKPDAGHIQIDGRTLFDSSTGINIAPDGRGCGYVFQDSRLFPHKTVTANLTYGQGRLAKNSPIISQDDVIAMLGIGHLLGRWPATLSGGETKRVAIGRALLSAPRFLLLDEPLASLDPERGEQILLMIEKLRDQLEIPIVYVSHDRSEVARLTATIITLD